MKEITRLDNSIKRKGDNHEIFAKIFQVDALNIIQNRCKNMMVKKV